MSIAVYTSLYYMLTYFAGSFGRYKIHAKVFCLLMTIYPIVTALTGFQFCNLLPYLLQVVPTVSGYCIWQHKPPFLGFRGCRTIKIFFVRPQSGFQMPPGLALARAEFPTWH
ncbi:hypothetical protein DSO57_1039783 [Entomophthora muscae]|uniref:Uncharacterized protein n=1 Tax=Entomophthora muscae TaxID=34485 RepID=A0ACC2RKN4_9FUNG|nr:hypothetical protein DSO57_1039783 [Entomophthora muscae]